jgi:hypothetical protein
LPGYLYAANRISQVSVSGRVVTSPSTQVVTIELNAFTSPFSLLNAPKTDPEAFEQTLQRIVSVSPPDFICALYDEYGTPYGINSRLNGVSGNNLQFTGGAFDGAVAGDIIMMDVASNAFAGSATDLAACWDAFQADGTGLVNGDAVFAYPWSR